MDSTSIITQVSREDELLNTFPASEKGKQVALQVVVSKMALKCWYAKAPACFSAIYAQLRCVCDNQFMFLGFIRCLECVFLLSGVVLSLAYFDRS